MKFAVILGTRPEIIKMSSTIRYLEKEKHDYCIIHTNQHYSKEMDEVFFNELHLPPATKNLGIGSGSHPQQIGKMLLALENALNQTSPDIVFVQGDTNTVLAGALCANKMGINVAHVEAGLRSFDRAMPEEVNRIVADHVSDFLFAPTEAASDILQSSNIPVSKIYVVGNPIVDAVYEGLPLSIPPDGVDGKSEFFLLTLHRPANVDIPSVFNNIMDGLRRVVKRTGIKIVFPIHPRTQLMMDKYHHPGFVGLNIIQPTSFLEMLWLEKNAKMIFTDSGGVQEEACILGKKTITLRNNTERPETVTVGSNAIAGMKPVQIVHCALEMLSNTKTWQNPYGNGTTGKKMVDIIIKRFA